LEWAAATTGVQAFLGISISAGTVRVIMPEKRCRSSGVRSSRLKSVV
jgi:hypothetical protein